MVEAITNSLTDMDRIIEYTAEDFIATVTASIEDMISVINTEYHHHQDLIKDPINNDGLVKAIAHGANQLGQLIKKIKRISEDIIMEYSNQYKWVNSKSILSSAKYQRDVNQTRIIRMLAEFDQTLVNPRSCHSGMVSILYSMGSTPSPY